MDTENLTPEEKKRRLFWGTLRLVFGVAQMSGATGALYLLVTVGPDTPTLIMTAATLSLTIASRIIFRDHKPPAKAS